MFQGFEDRRDAGLQLAAAVQARIGAGAVTVLGLPRGGVPVAAPVAAALGVPLDVLVVRKVGTPYQPELAMGAVATGNVTLRNEEVLAQLPGAAEAFDAVAARERAELQRRESAYRGTRPALDLGSQTAVLVDDGIATGSTLRAAIMAARRLGAQRVVVAVPVASRAAAATVGAEADEFVCLATPENFMAVGQWYRRFPQVEDSEVRTLLTQGRTTVR